MHYVIFKEATAHITIDTHMTGSLLSHRVITKLIVHKAPMTFLVAKGNLVNDQ